MKFSTITALLVLSLYATSTYAQNEPEDSWNAQTKQGLVLVPKWEKDSVYTLHITDITTDRSVAPQKVDTSSYDLKCQIMISLRGNYEIIFTYSHVKISKTSTDPMEHMLALVENMPFSLSYIYPNGLANRYYIIEFKQALKKGLDKLIKAEPKDSYLAKSYIYFKDNLDSYYILRLLCDHISSYLTIYEHSYNLDISKDYTYPLHKVALTRSTANVNIKALLKTSPDNKNNYVLTQTITSSKPKGFDRFVGSFYGTANKKIDPNNPLWQLSETTSHTMDANSSIISNVHIVQDIYIGPLNRLLVRDIVLVK